MSIPYFRLDRASRTSLSDQIAEQCIRMIRTRRWKPGQSLPTTRELSSHLNISLETAHKAYQSLQKEGWIVSRPRHGTVVSPDLPSSATILPPKQEQKRMALLKEMRKNATLPGIIPVSGISLPPEEELMKAIKDIAAPAVEAAMKVEEANPFGLTALRRKIQELLSARGFWVEPSAICMVNGTQQAIWLLADQLVKEGDVVGIPEMCYLPIKEAFVEKGARVIPIKQDGNGIDLEHLELVCRTEHLSLLYAMPNAHYPTGESWVMRKKEAVLQLAAQMNFAIIEDDYFGELYYTAHPPATLYSLAEQTLEYQKISVYYISSFSPIIHPHLRLGYMVVPAEATGRFEHAKLLLDTTTSVISQQIFLMLWDEVDFPAYLDRLRSRLHHARDAMMQSLHRWMPKSFTFSDPKAGVCTWVYAPAPFNSLSFFERCLSENVYAMPGEAFAVEDPIPGFQVKLGTIPPEVLDEGLKRISKVLAAMSFV